jgi:hypothetical protein
MKRLAVILLALGCCGCAAAQEPGRFLTIIVKDKPFRVEVAETDEQHARGLMHRRSLAAGSGMLFIFADEDYRSFWMKNTLIPLDMIFINGDRLVVDLVRRAPPCRADPCPNYTSAYPARYVLELAGGSAEALGLQPGDKIFLPID